MKVAETGETVGMRGSALRDVDPGSGAPLLELALPDWARILFGPTLPEALPPEWADHEFVRRAFPLPVFWPGLSNV